MKLDVVIPTRKRTEKLITCLRSFALSLSPDDRVNVYFDSAEDAAALSLREPHLSGLMNAYVCPEYRAPNLWNDHLYGMTADAMMYLNDDVAFRPGMFAAAKEAFWRSFPSGDGVIGMQQANLAGRFDTAPAAFGIMGRRFAENFPQRMAFCPDYHHLWIDRELEMVAKAWGRFVFCPTVKIDHFHPCLAQKYHDETHDHIRRWKDVDRATWQKRRELGLVWGLSWQLVN